jgi:hypothetical protein
MAEPDRVYVQVKRPGNHDATFYCARRRATGSEKNGKKELTTAGEKSKAEPLDVDPLPFAGGRAVGKVQGSRVHARGRGGVKDHCAANNHACIHSAISDCYPPSQIVTRHLRF